MKNVNFINHENFVAYKRSHGQSLFRFPNGYGASVVCHAGSYGGNKGLYELAVLKYESDHPDDWVLTYDTPITDYVIGYLDTEEVLKVLSDIKALKNTPTAIGALKNITNSILPRGFKK